MVSWEPKKCGHSTNCICNLPQAFNSTKQPWVDIKAAEAEVIKGCIDICPSEL
jgi:uncharacterized Fe-S cluster protein YjdI